MRLSDADFNELVACVDGGTLLEGVEGRHVPRIFVNATLMIRLDDRAPRQVQVYDVSAEGIGFLVSERLLVGGQIVAEMERPGRDPLSLLCEVRHCDQDSSGDYRVGVAFIESPR